MLFLAPAVSHSSTPSSGSSFAEIGAMRYKNVNFKATIFFSIGAIQCAILELGQFAVEKIALFLLYL